jgi:hypothetical protein
MGRPPKDWAELGLAPLRQYWQQINREQRKADAELRARRKTTDKKRAKCRCEAYKFPHRPGGGLCRYPDPPAVRWQDAHAAKLAAEVEQFKAHWGEPTAEQLAELITYVTKQHRPYRKRYAGIRRQIARANGLHPIRDRAIIKALMPRVLAQAKQLKREAPKAKYRFMEITQNGVAAQWQNAGPMM